MFHAAWGPSTGTSAHTRQLRPSHSGRRLPCQHGAAVATSHGRSEFAAHASGTEFTDGVLLGQDVERKRIAQELHDDISQRLALVGINLSDVEQLVRISGGPEAEQKLRTIRQNIESIASDVHRISYNLHPVSLAYLGLVSALRTLCRDFSKRIDVEFTSNVASSLASADVSISLYRVAQECLTNVVRHSGSARARVAFTEYPEALQLTIADDGVGFDIDRLPSSGLGLVGIRERVRRVGGDVEIASAPRRGVTVTVRVPLAASVRTQADRPRIPARVHETADAG